MLIDKEAIIRMVIQELEDNQDLRERLSKLLCRDEEIILKGNNIKIEVKK